jgi:hypothetical protein
VFGSGQREGVVSGLRLLARSGRIWCGCVCLRLLGTEAVRQHFDRLTAIRRFDLIGSKDTVGIRQQCIQ